MHSNRFLLAEKTLHLVSPIRTMLFSASISNPFPLSVTLFGLDVSIDSTNGVESFDQLKSHEPLHLETIPFIFTVI